MKITKRRDATDPKQWRVYADGKLTGLYLAYDASNKEWDLSSETYYLMSATSTAIMLERLKVLLAVLGVK